MSDQATALAVHEENPDLVPSFVMQVSQAKQQIVQLQAFVQQVMVEGVDYGKIPGVDRPTLLKPGAEKLCEIYGYAPEVEVTSRIEDWDKPFFHYEIRVSLRSKRTGNVIGQGVGSCNSREKRYADRWVWPNEVPADVDKNLLKRRDFQGKGGKQFHKYLMPNEDICTLVNTILKMAKKRALVDAVLSVTRSSGMFTQDVEDIVDGEARAVEAEATPAETAPKAKPPERAAILKRWDALWEEATVMLHLPADQLPAIASTDSNETAIEKGKQLANIIAQERQSREAF